MNIQDEARRNELIAEIRQEFTETAGYTGLGQLDARVEAALREVDRSRFVPEETRGAAWVNAPLPIGHGQTISQPYIVALMTQLLEIEPGDRILEIGTGSGYQAAILCALGATVFSVEVIGDLAERARARLEQEGFAVNQRHTNGYQGWRDEAPFDGIIVTAASPEIPPALVGQLKPGGRLVIPVGPRWGYQSLVLVEKDADGKVHEKNVLGVAFVPLVKSSEERDD
ncbi:MAG: protein-L-isoaspartate(D-aspartate) O-methyltransferase [Gammaproteobacteria bacterium]|jgi:protein-L-isoaspartate(D-aspartate) O-methyltransferase